MSNWQKKCEWPLLIFGIISTKLEEPWLLGEHVYSHAWWDTWTDFIMMLFLTLQSEFSSCGEKKKSSRLPHQQLGCWPPLLVYRSHCQSEASQGLLTYRVSLLVVFVVLLNCHESITCVSISVLAACVWQEELCWRVTEACGRQKW